MYLSHLPRIPDGFVAFRDAHGRVVSSQREEAGSGREADGRRGMPGDAEGTAVREEAWLETSADQVKLESQRWPEKTLL